MRMFEAWFLRFSKECPVNFQMYEFSIRLNLKHLCMKTGISQWIEIYWRRFLQIHHFHAEAINTRRDNDMMNKFHNNTFPSCDFLHWLRLVNLKFQIESSSDFFKWFFQKFKISRKNLQVTINPHINFPLAKSITSFKSKSKQDWMKQL